MADIDPVKLKIAQQAALMFINQMDATGVPPDVQLMAIELAAKTRLSQVKESKRLWFLDAWLKSIRDDIAGALKKKKSKA